MAGINSDTSSSGTTKKTLRDRVSVHVGLDWQCPSWGINWHRCYGYLNFSFWPFYLNIEHGEGFEKDAD